MSTTDAPPPPLANGAWLTQTVELEGRSYVITTLPGAADSEAIDGVAYLLGAMLQPAATDQVLIFNGGSGLLAVLAARRVRPRALTLTDASIIHVNAARHTLAANELRAALVVHSHGLSHLTVPAPVDLVAIRLPKGRQPALQLVWDGFHALGLGGRLLVAGGNSEGIQPLTKGLQAIFGNVALLTTRRGVRVLGAIKQQATPAAPAALPLTDLDHQHYQSRPVMVAGHHYTLLTRPGLFAWQGLDAGTRLLAETMTVRPGERVLELGCGHGLLGLVAAQQTDPAKVVLVDSDIIAVEAARRTVAANDRGAIEVLAADGTRPLDRGHFHLIISNPPFHVTKAARFDVAVGFIQAAAAQLQPGGRLLLVANRFIPYERTLQTLFGNHQQLAADSRYKVLQVSRALD